MIEFNDKNKQLISTSEVEQIVVKALGEIKDKVHNYITLDTRTRLNKHLDNVRISIKAIISD